MKMLFIGGNGNISWYCVDLALRRGHNVYILNRSMTTKTRRAVQLGVQKLTADIHDLATVQKMLYDCAFDVVLDFICYNEKHAAEAVQLFSGKTKHFIYISSDSVYKRNARNLPYQEDCEQNNPELSGSYVAGKIMAERAFLRAYHETGFPLTIIRPAHVYDTIVPVSIGQNCFTAPQKYLDGKPALIGGDGTNLWEFTHASDFAAACIPLAENTDTIGEDFHIATEELLTWNDGMEMLFAALGIKQYRAVHIPHDEASKLDIFQDQDLTAQKLFHNLHDMSKVKQFVPEWHARVSYDEGIRRTIEWLNERPERRRIIPKYSDALDELYQKYDG